MRLGLIPPMERSIITDAEYVAGLAGVLEESEVESVWAVEHVVVAENYEPLYPYSPDGRMPGGGGDTVMPDPLEWLCFVAAPRGAAPIPQLPTTHVVTPPTDLKAMSGCSIAAKSSWVCTSMNPGASARPVASTSLVAAAETEPTSTTRSPSTATSAVVAGAPEPS